MPQINLLSPTLSKKIKKVKTFELPKVDVPAFSSAIFTVVVPWLAFFLMVSLVLFIFAGKKSSDLERLNKKEQDLAIDPQELIKFNNRKAALQKKIALLSDLSSQKFYWADKLSDISDCLPNGVWLSEISVEQRKVFGENLPGKKEEIEQKILTIKGSAIAPQIDNAVSFIGEFVNSLKQKTAFSQDFSEIKLSAIYKGTIGKSDVMNFELTGTLLK